MHDIILMLLYYNIMIKIFASPTHLYTTHAGEPFTQEEVDEMLTAAVDPEKGVILYRDFVTLMLPDSSENA